LKIGLSALGSIVILALLFFTKNTSAVKVLLPLAAIMFFLDSMQEFAYALNRAYEKMENEAYSKILSNIILAIVAFLLISRSHTALSLAYGYIAADIIATIFIFRSVHDHTRNIFKKVKKVLLWPIFIEAWPIGVVTIFGTILGSIDTIILGWFKNLQEVGFYAAAQKPIQLLILFPGLISTALLPVFSRLSFNKSDMLKKTLAQSITLAMAISLPIVVGGVLLSTKIIVLLFGSQYTQSGILFAIMLIALLTTTSGSILYNALFAEGQQKKILWSIAIGAISNIILCIILIPQYGMYGAAVATTISQTITNIFFMIYAKKIPALQYCIKSNKIIISTLLMGTLILLLKPFMSFILLIPLAIAVYLLLLVVMKEQIIQDIRLALHN
jgi:O-antigen/teichoic acid export membrane protein